MTVWLGALLAGLAIAVLNREAWGWLPILSRAVIWMETRLLPKQRRKLRQEEWLGELSARYDDRRLTGLLWTLRLLPICVWERATAPAGNPFFRPSQLLPLAVAIAAAFLLWPKNSPEGLNTPHTFGLPPGYEPAKCTYDIEGRADLPKEAHDIQPRGRIEQDFIAAEPYIWLLDVIIGYNPSRSSRKPGPVQMELLDDDRHVIARNDNIRISINRRTKFQFAPVKVKPGKRYWVRVVNTSGITLGMYMRYAPGPNGGHRRPTGAGTTLVYGEVHRDDGERQDALVGCVGGARRTGR